MFQNEAMPALWGSFGQKFLDSDHGISRESVRVSNSQKASILSTTIASVL